ncbi:MAG: hypothetical protein AAF489_11825 [Bacteroidota bacterium]
MKIILIITALIFTWTAQGQKEIDTLEMTRYHINEIENVIDLSEDQKKETHTTISNFSQKMAGVMSEDGGMMGKIGEIKKIGKEKNGKLKSIFTASQMELYLDKIEPKVRKHMRKAIKDQKQ